MVALWYKMAPLQGVSLNHRNRWKIFKNLLLQNHLPQMFEIRYVALPGGLLPSLFKPRSRVQNGLRPGAPGFEA